MNGTEILGSGRRIAGTSLIILSGSAVSLSAIVKFLGVPAVVQKMAIAGFSGRKLLLVASLEIVSATLFLYRRTRPFGLLFLSAFLGGAVCSHVQMGQYADAGGPRMILALAWLGTWIRHPQSLWDSSGGGAASFSSRSQHPSSIVSVGTAGR